MAATTGVLVCRGCCCGQGDPDQAARRLELLQAADGRSGRLTITTCLGPCSERDVTVIRQPDPTVRSGLRSTWLRHIGDRAAEHLATWLRAGAPGDIPAELTDHVFPAPNRRSPAKIRAGDLMPGTELHATRVEGDAGRALLTQML